MTLDPVLKQLLDQVPAIPDGPIDYPALRAEADAFVAILAPPASLEAVLSVEERSISNSSGSRPARIYRPVGSPTGVLHYIHGGGWAVGNLATVDQIARRLCSALSMLIVTSTYRLAPENPFPAGYDDSLSAARWVLDHRDELGVEGLPAVIAGDSAGAISRLRLPWRRVVAANLFSTCNSFFFPQWTYGLTQINTRRVARTPIRLCGEIG